MSDQPLHVIIQAGGRGSRLRHHTWNKPKCLVSVRGKPILYHLFEEFGAAKFIVIGDYLYEQLERYLKINPPAVEVTLIKTQEKGTASGIADALALIPPEAPVALTWSDLIISSLPPWPQTNVPVICTTSAFTCRWTVSPEGKLRELPADSNGIPGLFYFSKAKNVPSLPQRGEFVKWFAANVPSYELLDCPDMEELGDFSVIEESNDRAGFCRFFNKVELGDGEVVKTVVDPAYAPVHEKEVAWYGEAKALGFRRIPKVYSLAPLRMERIHGNHAYQMNDLSPREQRAVMADYLDSLINLHDLDKKEPDLEDAREVYLHKTLQRVQSVSQIIPGFDKPAMTVNGKKCKNIFYGDNEKLLSDIFKKVIPDSFKPIHGDPTFSNSIIDDKLRVWFIDPRGYFAKPGIMGDPWYDFAKVYYSAMGGYDAFNRRKFKLHVDEETVEVLMEEPLFAKTAESIFKDYFGAETQRIEILHALIWFALAGYAKDDVDSVIGSFYMGAYWLESSINK